MRGKSNSIHQGHNEKFIVPLRHVKLSRSIMSKLAAFFCAFFHCLSAAANEPGRQSYVVAQSTVVDLMRRCEGTNLEGKRLYQDFSGSKIGYCCTTPDKAQGWCCWDNGAGD